MFLPFYSLPRITMRMALKEDIPITSSYDMQLLNESHAESLSSLHEPTYPNLDILYNPIHLFLFLTFDMQQANNYLNVHPYIHHLHYEIRWIDINQWT